MKKIYIIPQIEQLHTSNVLLTSSRYNDVGNFGFGDDEDDDREGDDNWDDNWSWGKD